MIDTHDAQRNALALLRAVVLEDTDTARALYLPLNEQQRTALTFALAGQSHGYLRAAITATTGQPAENINPQQLAEAIQTELARLAAHPPTA